MEGSTELNRTDAISVVVGYALRMIVNYLLKSVNSAMVADTHSDNQKEVDTTTGNRMGTHEITREL